MRVVAGKFRGRRLVSPGGMATRPTTDRTRESLFNILGSRLDISGLSVLDLFAGTGALGLECLSRGAQFCLFVESSTPACAAIRSNIETLGAGALCRVERRDATALGKSGPGRQFDLVFADPPYSKGLGEKAARAARQGGWIVAGGLFVLEESADTFPARLEGFDLVDARNFGGTGIGIFKLDAAPI